MANSNIILLDSMQSLNSSLANLEKNLQDKDFKYLTKEFPNIDIKLLRGKELYPYDWVTSIKKLNYPKLPPKEAFHSSINANQRGKGDGHISDEDYEHLQNIWKILAFKTFKDFHMYYLKKDVLTLADIFDNFIDPCHYFSSPELTWDALLKMTGQELEKIPNADMHYFFERAKRGGICDVITRYFKANNPDCTDYDPTKETKYINYIDMNNLYGYAMHDFSSYGGLEFIEVTDESIKEALTTPDDSEYGSFLEVDMECPKKRNRERQREFPMAPEKMKVTEDMLPPEHIDIKNNLIFQ